MDSPIKYVLLYIQIHIYIFDGDNVHVKNTSSQDKGYVVLKCARHQQHSYFAIKIAYCNSQESHERHVMFTFKYHFMRLKNCLMGNYRHRVYTDRMYAIFYSTRTVDYLNHRFFFNNHHLYTCRPTTQFIMTYVLIMLKL